MARNRNINKPAPYIDMIQRDLDARKDWNEQDNLILKRRLGERKSNNVPYRGAPNPVVNILDDTITDRTDTEISMIMNAPRLANFIPIGNTEKSLAMQAQQAFDTLLRHYMGFRKKKEEAVDIKNARGFSVCIVTTEIDPDLGEIPTFEVVDPKDIIVPSNSAETTKLERFVRVIRMSDRVFRGKKNDGWKNTGQVINRLGNNNRDKNEPSRTNEQNTSDNTSAVTSHLIGINTTDPTTGEIVVWEIWHYATQWDIDNDTTGQLELGKKCRTYIVPDFPELLLFARPWTTEAVVEEFDQEQQIRENIAALREGRDALTEIVVEESKDKPWNIIQHRFENRSRFWYNTRGLGHLNMDNHMTATGLKKRKLVMADYYYNPAFERTSDFQGSNTQSLSMRPGKLLPVGAKPIQMPTPPSNIDFDIDGEKRDAGNRSGGGGSQFSAQITENRKLQKTATESQIEASRSAMLSSASVDRFNDADRELFRQLWDELVRLKVELPIIENNESKQMADLAIYEGKYKIVPATSQKNLNPDLEFMKWKEAYQFVLDVGIQLGWPIQAIEEMKRGLALYDSNFANNMIPETQGADNPFTLLLKQIVQKVQENGEDVEGLQDAIEQLGKLAIDTKNELDEKIEEDDQDAEKAEKTLNQLARAEESA